MRNWPGSAKAAATTAMIRSRPGAHRTAGHRRIPAGGTGPLDPAVRHGLGRALDEAALADGADSLALGVAYAEDNRHHWYLFRVITKSIRIRMNIRLCQSMAGPVLTEMMVAVVRVASA